MPGPPHYESPYDPANYPEYGFTRHGHAVHAHTFDHLPGRSTIQRLNKRLALRITRAVGTMWCAYLFVGLALVSFGAALRAFTHGDTVTGVGWVSQTLFQLVLLPVIIVGQNQQNAAADARAAKTFEDVEAVKRDVATALDRLDCNTEGGLRTIVEQLDRLETR